MYALHLYGVTMGFLNPKTKFSTVVRHGGDFGPRPRPFSPSGVFSWIFFYGGCVLADRSPPSWKPLLLLAVGTGQFGTSGRWQNRGLWGIWEVFGKNVGRHKKIYQNFFGTNYKKNKGGKHCSATAGMDSGRLRVACGSSGAWKPLGHSGRAPEWLSIPPLVAAVLITSKGAESPGSGRIGVIGALVFFPIWDRLG